MGSRGAPMDSGIASEQVARKVAVQVAYNAFILWTAMRDFGVRWLATALPAGKKRDQRSRTRYA